MDIIKALEKYELKGRGGANFPTWRKWQMVDQSRGRRKFVIANGSEGEPGMHKDGYILRHHADRLIDGLKIALHRLDAEEAYLFLNHNYYDEFRDILTPLIGKSPITLFRKKDSGGYIGGEETSVINSIEGRRIEPRLRPPYPTVCGLFQSPTLVSNIETFHDVSLIAAGEYENKRFYAINGSVHWPGVYHLSERWPIAVVLRETRNYPDFPFFVQIGGDASGEVFHMSQTERTAAGGAITVHNLSQHEPWRLLRYWADFYARESCGQCTPCREGTYRLREQMHSHAPDWALTADLLRNLKDSSFCGLGISAYYPFSAYFRNIWPHLDEQQKAHLASTEDYNKYLQNI